MTLRGLTLLTPRLELMLSPLTWSTSLTWYSWSSSSFSSWTITNYWDVAHLVVLPTQVDSCDLMYPELHHEAAWKFDTKKTNDLTVCILNRKEQCKPVLCALSVHNYKKSESFLSTSHFQAHRAHHPCAPAATWHRFLDDPSTTRDTDTPPSPLWEKIICNIISWQFQENSLNDWCHSRFKINPKQLLSEFHWNYGILWDGCCLPLSQLISRPSSTSFPWQMIQARMLDQLSLES